MLQRAMRACGQRFGLQTLLLGYLLLFCLASPSFALSAGESKTTDQTGISSSQVELEGELEVLHEDDFKNKKSRTRHFLKTETGERYELRFKSNAPHHQSGAKLRIKGAKSGNILYLDTSSAGSTQVLAQPVAANTFGEQKVAVILVTFSDKTTQPFTSAKANDVFFGSTNSATNFYKENSFGQTWLSGNVLGWYALPIPSTSDTGTIAAYAQQAVKAAGIDLSTYSRYVYVFPKHATYPWAGMATVGGTPSQTWLNGTIDLQPVNHELGHNLGLDHAKYLYCGTVILGNNCTINDYGDPSDNMGGYSTAHFDAFHKEQLGWLNSDMMPPITTVSTNGTYTLAPYETTSNQPKALKVLKSINSTSGAKTWYYIEYRQPIGFDTVLPTLMPGFNNNLTLGVQIRLGTEGDLSSSYLLDMTPTSDAGQYDSTLILGQSYVDSAAGIVIQILSADVNGATVSVNVSSELTPPCIRANPSVLMSSSQSASVPPGTTISYTVAITNNDSSACSSSAFSLKGSVPSGWGSSLNSTALTIGPGGVASTTFSVTSSTSATTGSYSVGVTATNNASTNSASGSASYSITSTTGTASRGGGKGRVK